MNCRHVRPELADFVNGKLDETVRKSVAAHLETCERCRAEAEEFRELFGLLKTPAVARPSDAYWASVLPRIHERIDRQSARLLPSWIGKYAMPAASAVILAVCLFNVLPRHGLDESQELTTMLQDLRTDEIQQAAAEQSYGGVLQPSAAAGEHTFTATDDEEILSGLLQSDTQQSVLLNIDAEATLKNMSAGQEDEIVSILQQKYFSN